MFCLVMCFIEWFQCIHGLPVNLLIYMNMYVIMYVCYYNSNPPSIVVSTHWLIILVNVPLLITWCPFNLPISSRSDVTNNELLGTESAMTTRQSSDVLKC